MNIWRSIWENWQACDCALDGLLGADFFRKHVVQIDFAAHNVRLLRRGPQPVEGEVLPLETRRCGLRVPIRIDGGKPQWFRLDTGCATPLQWVKFDVAGKVCTPQPAVALTELDIPTAQVAVRIGKTQFNSAPAGLHQREIFAGESGLLGNGLLSRFDLVTIDTKAGRLILQKVL